MPANLVKRITRVMSLPGFNNQQVVVSLNAEGIFYRIKGSRTVVSLTHFDAINHAFTPSTVPSYLWGNARALLEHEAAKVATRKEKREKL